MHSPFYKAKYGRKSILSNYKAPNIFLCLGRIWGGWGGWGRWGAWAWWRKNVCNRDGGRGRRDWGQDGGQWHGRNHGVIVTVNCKKYYYLRNST